MVEELLCVLASTKSSSNFGAECAEMGQVDIMCFFILQQCLRHYEFVPETTKPRSKATAALCLELHHMLDM